MQGDTLERIGRYRVERVLGSGAFATVWMGFDESLDAQVAIKVLAENWLHDDDIRRRFVEEARILWRLDSERIIRVHTVDQLEDGRPYFVMDYADGGTLAARMSAHAEGGRRWTIGEAVALSVDIANGLAVAHAYGIVHRDLKPSNIMFKSGRDGRERMVLADFGIARSLEAGGGSTISAGTPHYMAPEQSDGRADRASDVYAAAVVLYELLAGKVPFPYPSAGQVIRAQLTEFAPDIRTVRPEVPALLAAALAHGLQADPARRYSTIDAWREGLTSATASNAEPTALRAETPGEETVRPIPLPPTGPPPPPAWAPPPPPTWNPSAPPTGPIGPPPDRPSSSRRWVIAAAILLALGLIIGIGVVVFSGNNSTTASKPGEIFLQPASVPGPDPFGPSTASPITPVAGVLSSASTSSPPTSSPVGATTGPVVINAQLGGTPELYGGSKQLGVCDKAAMIAFLQANPAKGAAWAAVQGISPSALPDYINKLTPVVLRSDTRVTNHGYANGKATAFQAVLQAGTAILVDEYGLPRARCACGNPLAPPVAAKTTPSYQGQPWPGFSPANVTVINKNTTVIINITVIDIQTGQPLSIPVGQSETSGSSTPTVPKSTSPTASAVASSKWKLSTVKFVPILGQPDYTVSSPPTATGGGLRLTLHDNGTICGGTGGTETVVLSWTFDRDITTLTNGDSFQATVNAAKAGSSGACTVGLSSRSGLDVGTTDGGSLPRTAWDRPAEVERFSGRTDSASADPSQGRNASVTGKVSVTTTPSNAATPESGFVVTIQGPGVEFFVLYIYDQT